MATEVDTFELAWSRIKILMEDYFKVAAVDAWLLRRLGRSLGVGTLKLSATQTELSDYEKKDNKLSFRQRSKAVGNDKTLLDHQDHVKG